MYPIGSGLDEVIFLSTIGDECVRVSVYAGRCAAVLGRVDLHEIFNKNRRGMLQILKHRIVGITPSFDCPW